jgi:competence ComEA-like helix-hairpin-helix protein
MLEALHARLVKLAILERLLKALLPDRPRLLDRRRLPDQLPQGPPPDRGEGRCGNGTDALWLEIVHPRLAVASLGRGNEYGHPHAQTLALLARRDIPLLRTDQDGSVKVTSDGKSWEVSSHKPAARGSPATGEADAKRVDKAEGRLIDINAATQAELESLPGIGPVIARRIIEGRPYRSVADLIRVKGIGEKRLEKIRSRVAAR